MEGDVGGECFVGPNQKVRYEKGVHSGTDQPTGCQTNRSTDGPTKATYRVTNSRLKNEFCNQYPEMSHLHRLPPQSPILLTAAVDEGDERQNNGEGDNDETEIVKERWFL